MCVAQMLLHFKAPVLSQALAEPAEELAQQYVLKLLWWFGSLPAN